MLSTNRRIVGCLRSPHLGNRDRWVLQMYPQTLYPQWRDRIQNSSTQVLSYLGFLQDWGYPSYSIPLRTLFQIILCIPGFSSRSLSTKHLYHSKNLNLASRKVAWLRTMLGCCPYQTRLLAFVVVFRAWERLSKKCSNSYASLRRWCDPGSWLNPIVNLLLVVIMPLDLVPKLSLLLWSTVWSLPF